MIVIIILTEWHVTTERGKNEQVGKFVIAANRLSPREKLEIEVKGKMRSPGEMPPPETTLEIEERNGGGVKM